MLDGSSSYLMEDARERCFVSGEAVSSTERGPIVG